MNILQTLTFGKQLKKLHKNQLQALNKAVEQIIKNPLIGEIKKGDLAQVKVYKFKMVKQLTLLAYKFNETESQIILLAVGSHENFYRDLK